MTDFASVPPSKKSPDPVGLFQGGLMPASEVDITALLIFDIRHFNLSKDKGRKLEEAMRSHLFKELERLDVKLGKRSAVDLSNAVFGIAVD